MFNVVFVSVDFRSVLWLYHCATPLLRQLLLSWYVRVEGRGDPPHIPFWEPQPLYRLCAFCTARYTFWAPQRASAEGVPAAASDDWPLGRCRRDNGSRVNLGLGALS